MEPLPIQRPPPAANRSLYEVRDAIGNVYRVALGGDRVATAAVLAASGWYSLRRMLPITGPHGGSTMLVQELCTRHPVTVEPSSTAADAARIMEQERVGSVVVVDADRRPVGILTDRDLVRRVMAHELDPAFCAVESVMTPDPITVDHELSLHDAVWRMRAYSVGRLPVVDDQGGVVGVINLRDVLRSMGRDIQNVGSLMSGQSGFWEA